VRSSSYRHHTQRLEEAALSREAVANLTQQRDLAREVAERNALAAERARQMTALVAQRLDAVQAAYDEIDAETAAVKQATSTTEALPVSRFERVRKELIGDAYE
jgi:hypothetical protein